jgi:hypothetical protein
MTDQPMDEFDARLTNLMAAYGDRAVTVYDAAAIARVATTRRRGVQLRLGLALNVGRGARLLLLATVVALLTLAVAFVAGSLRKGALTTTIELGPAGPERSVYRVPQGPPFELTLENRSDLTWVPWTGLAEKDYWCHLVSGQGLPNPCTVGPHSTIVLRPPSVLAGQADIYFAPPGVDWQKGIRVTIDVVAIP